ncbi:HNH endonuclease [Marivita sp. S0852]|uniref:HNH endonuclease n=1 Tax=Marivita sp. S0852 TaxID=3373893 RepID=UPI0039828A68
MSHSDPICPLCLRPIPAGVKQSQHHLVPKLKGGKGGPTILIHQMCHNEIHATLTEAELARDYNTPEALRAHPKLAAFFKWVSKRPGDFHARSTRSLRKQNSRKRR